jgi:hypothetical protein
MSKRSSLFRIIISDHLYSYILDYAKNKLPWTNTLAYLAIPSTRVFSALQYFYNDKMAELTKRQGKFPQNFFMKLTPGACTINIFMAVFDYIQQ